jgi:phage terminase large subunit-like protein
LATRKPHPKTSSAATASAPTARAGTRHKAPATKTTKKPSGSGAQKLKAKDFVGRAIAYAQRAAADHHPTFGRWIHLAAKRFLRDLERAAGPNPPFVFDKWHAEDPCDFIEKLPHVEGVWDTPNIQLHDSDVFFIVQLFGFRKADGTRRFTTALKAIARKNAKSTVAAAIGLYCETCEGENGPQVISGATTGSQARIVFGIAKRMVDMKSTLREAFSMEAFANAIACYSNGGTFKPINAKASTQDGLNPSCVILDEIHAHKSHDLLNVLRSAAGARKQPLFLFTTTEGYESPGPWPELRQFAKQVLLGIIEADHFLAIYYAVDEEDKDAGIKGDDDFDEKAWIKANPLMEVNPILMEELRKEAIEAKQMPGRHAEFKIKRLNRPSSVAMGWTNLTKWRACQGAIDLSYLKKFPCYGGLDLASTSDLTSFRLIWDVDGTLYTKGWRFVPSAAVLARKERGLVPYQHWVQGGVLIETPGDVTSYDAVFAQVMAAREEFMVEAIAYDMWNAAELVQRLKAEDVEMVQFIQGPKSYHPAMQKVEMHYMAGTFVHGNDPVLNWCASNLVARYDQNLNSAPDKKKAAEKIDDMCALFMAVGASISTEDNGLGDSLANPIVASRQ